MLWRWLRWVGFSALLAALVACGGSGAGGEDRNASISVDRTSIAVSATPADPAPVVSVELTAQGMPDDGLYAGVDASSNGLASATLVPLGDPAKARIDLVFKPAGLLADGVYTDTVTVHVCYDEYCRSYVRNSPLTLSLTYTVSSGSGSTAVASVLPTSLAVTGYTGSSTAPVSSVVITASEPISPAMVVLPTHTGRGILSVSAQTLSTTQTRLDITFRQPNLTSPGLYDDTVTLQVCYDSSCLRRLQGSPLTVSTRYTVTNEVQPEPGLTPLSVATRNALPHNVIDAEYSRALDAVVMVASWPAPALYVYDLASASERQLALPKAPTAVSVGPDGLYAAVGHDALITHVDLRSVGGSNLTRALNVSARVYDLVLGGNGYVYAFPAVDQWVAVHSIEIATNTESTPYSVIYAGTHARLHPSGTVLYTADNGLSPSDIQKYDLSAGVAASLYDSPYHGDYEMCGDLWFKGDGSQIYTACGNTFRSSTERSLDMVYAGALSLATDSSYRYRILSLSQSAAAREIALVEQTWYECSAASDLNDCKSHVVLFESDFLALKARYSLAPLAVSGSTYAQRGLFVFHRAGGSAKVLISRLHGMPNAATEYHLSTFD